MTPREKRIAIIALVFSAAAHAGVIVPMLNKPFSGARAALFEAAVERGQRARLLRVPDDALYDDRRAEPRLDEPTEAAEDPDDEAVRETAEQLLDRADELAALTEPTMPALPAWSAEESEVPMPAPDRPVEAGVAEGIDASERLISRSDPSLSLPRFVGPTDHPDLPEPGEAGGGAGGAGAGGTGTGGGGAALDAGAVNAALAEAADEAMSGAFDLGGVEAAAVPSPGPPEAEIDLGVEEEALPDLVEAIEAPPEPGDEGPAVDISDAVDPTLRVFAEPLNRGFGLFGGGNKELEGPGWFELAIRTRRAARPVKPLDKDVVYVIDISSSIGERWLKAVNAGVKAAMDSLNDGDRFNIVLFSTELRLFNDRGLAEPTKANLEAAGEFLDRAESSGYTDVNKALRHLVRGDPGDDRVYQVIFISDGRPTSGTIGPRQIIDVFTRANDLVAAVYAVAIGDKVNLPLIGSLAYRNKGYVERSDNWVKTTGVIRDLASRLRKPIVKDASINAAGVDTRMLFPKGPLDIYQDDPLRLRGRFDEDDKAISVRIVGRNRDRQIAFRERASFDRAAEGERAIAEAWARSFANYLTTRMLTADAAEKAALKERVEAIGKKYDLW